ncbi:hypothetical protein QBC42DRAFT_187704, partial [Cladorrhinum samala]
MLLYNISRSPSTTFHPFLPTTPSPKHTSLFGPNTDFQTSLAVQHDFYPGQLHSLCHPHLSPFFTAPPARASPPPKMPPNNLPRSRRGELTVLRDGVDIALAYFNAGDNESPEKLAVRAKKWADRYFKGYDHASQRSTTLLGQFPNLFNLGVQPHLRIDSAVPEPSAKLMAAAAAIKEPESGSMRLFRSLERAAMNSEPFPSYAEPLVASEEQIEDLLNSQHRRTPGSELDGNIDAQTLLESGLLWSLPEFLAQLSRVDADKEAKLADSPALAAVKVEDEMDVVMDDVPELIETQKRRRARRVILPGSHSLKLPGDDDDRGDVTSEDARSRRSSISDDDCGYETNTSSSTVASLRVNLKKRKAAQMSGDIVETELPGKIRLHKHHVDEVVLYYDKESNTLRRKRNPLFDAQRETPATQPAQALECVPAGLGSAADDCVLEPSNSVRPMKPIRVVRISAPLSFDRGSPTEDRKVIVLKVPGTPSPS